MPHRILIVEDEPLLAMGLEDLVEDAGYEVVGIAATMAAALRLADGAGVDIAIMDVRLAGGDSGLETAKRLREHHNVRSLFVSGSLTDRVKAAALPWQPIGFINKPYEASAVIAALKAV